MDEQGSNREVRGVRFRKLQIAWSATCGILFLLLVAQWVRSYSQWDQIYNPVSSETLILVESASGRVIFDWTIASPGATWRWHLTRPLSGEYWRGALQELQTKNRYNGFAGFGFYGNPWHTIFRAPYWFSVVLVAAFATMPWIRWSKHFSLRTLLIVMTLVALGLGFAAYVLSKETHFTDSQPASTFARPGRR